MPAGTASDSAELAIRMRRAAFNHALAESDLDAIGSILANNVIVITGTDSAIISGRKAQMLVWKREFAVADRTIYTRLTERVEGSPLVPFALEHGHWQGVSSSGQHLASGTYVAKWRKDDKDWMLEAEVFLTLG